VPKDLKGEFVLRLKYDIKPFELKAKNATLTLD